MGGIHRASRGNKKRTNTKTTNPLSQTEYEHCYNCIIQTGDTVLGKKDRVDNLFIFPRVKSNCTFIMTVHTNQGDKLLNYCMDKANQQYSDQ